MAERTGLEGKVVVVTGGGSLGDEIGNGRAAAVLCARAGAIVVVVGRTAEPLARTVAMIEADGGTATAITGDVTDDDECHRIVEETVARHGRLDGLDNNVGASTPGTIVDIPLERWRAAMALNVESQLLMSRHAIPAMIATAGGGSIVNISSVSAIRPKGNAASYTVTKAADMALTQAMAVDHGPQGIRVNCVVIGPVYAPISFRGGTSMSPERRRARAELNLLKVEGTAWDTGEVVRFLLSDRSRFVTGQCINVDGGITLIGPPR